MRVFHHIVIVCFVLLSFHRANAFSGTCESVFRAQHDEIAHVSQGPTLPLKLIPWPPLREQRLLSKELLESMFEGIETGEKAGSAAIRYMKTLPREMDSATKADVWNELVRFIANYKFILFISDMYELDTGRFLFRGGTGHSLFIDSDGQIYRLMTRPLDRQTTWELDRTQLTPIVPQ